MRLPIQRSAYSGSEFLVRLSACLTIATILLGGFSVSATPVPAVHFGKLVSRACPSTDEILPVLRSKGLGGSTVFYTRPTPSHQAANFANFLTPRGQCFASLVTETQQYNWLDQCKVDLKPGQTQQNQENLLARMISQALAEGSTGTAYILISPGADIYQPGSIWADVEFPALRRNPAITRIVRVNPDNVEEQSVAWTPARRS